MTRLPLILAALLSTGALTVSRPAPAPDEGMWTFANPPLEFLAKEYGFKPDQAWFDHLRQASVRFNSGGSGSFVGRDGLVLTNHHVGLESVQKLSSLEHNYVDDGFYAAERSAELRCPDLELNVLMSMEEVTEKVQESDDPDSTMQMIEGEESQRQFAESYNSWLPRRLQKSTLFIVVEI